MLDLLFVGILVVFFGVALLFVRLCDSIIGPQEVAASPAGDEIEKVAA